MAGSPVRGTALWVPILIVMVAVIFAVFWSADEPAPPPAAETIQEAPK
jgi:hypothetical protein